jgi:hypothetical protein
MEPHEWHVSVLSDTSALGNYDCNNQVHLMINAVTGEVQSPGKPKGAVIRIV